jgi:hypothetical protein
VSAPCKSLGIAVARLVYRGLVTEARALAGGRDTWTASECRAILGAGRALKRLGVENGVEVARSVMGW